MNIVEDYSFNFFVFRSKSCKKELWTQINTALQANSKWQRLDSINSDLNSQHISNPSSNILTQQQPQQSHSHQHSQQQNLLNGGTSGVGGGTTINVGSNSSTGSGSLSQNSGIFSTMLTLPTSNQNINVISTPIVVDFSNVTVNCMHDNRDKEY